MLHVNCPSIRHGKNADARQGLPEYGQTLTPSLILFNESSSKVVLRTQFCHLPNTIRYNLRKIHFYYIIFNIRWKENACLLGFVLVGRGDLVTSTTEYQQLVTTPTEYQLKRSAAIPVSRNAQHSVILPFHPAVFLSTGRAPSPGKLRVDTTRNFPCVFLTFSGRSSRIPFDDPRDTAFVVIVILATKPL